MKDDLGIFLHDKGVTQHICDAIEALWVEKGEDLDNIKYGAILVVLMHNINYGDCDIDPMSEARYNKDVAAIIWKLVQEYGSIDEKVNYD